ncbi:hypothetical protein AAVH_15068 [Aphelenchoides avenae]|nr:hypothetical protein AAVH_15068 [Aphelenchus avenae]
MTLFALYDVTDAATCSRCGEEKKQLPSTTNNTFTFDDSTSFIRASFKVPTNSTLIVGYVEAESREWFITFEVITGLSRLPSTFPYIDPSLADRQFSLCEHSDSGELAVQELEYQLHSTSVTIRGHNSERYDFPEALLFGQRFKILLLDASEDGDGTCLLPTTFRHTSTSNFSTHLEGSASTEAPTAARKVSLFGTDFNESLPKRTTVKVPRRTTGTHIPSSTTKRYTGTNVRFATYKMQRIRSTTPTASAVAYIDIIKDRETYEQVQRSRTMEVNSIWSGTFLAFMGVQGILVGSFVLFGLAMFVLLQCRPKNKEKHIQIEV